MEREKIPVILSTDIGSDIDDALALQCLALSPKFRLASVIVTHGVLETRAKLARKMLDNLGLKEIPVAFGAEKALEGSTNLPPYTTGFETIALSKKQRERGLKSKTDGVSLLIEQIKSMNPIVISIAPLTTLALALKKAPEIASKILHLYILGGAINGGEHNFTHDPLAARLVLASGIPTTLFPIDFVRSIHYSELAQLKGSPNQRMIAIMAKALKIHRELDGLWKKIIEGDSKLSLFFKQSLNCNPFSESLAPVIKAEFLEWFKSTWPKLLENQGKKQDSKDSFVEDITSAMLVYIALDKLLNKENWLDDFNDCMDSLNIQLNFTKFIKSKGHGIFRETYNSCLVEWFPVYDAYIPYIMENPEKVKTKKFSLEVGRAGEMKMMDGGQHEVVGLVDHEHFRQFLTERLRTDSKKTQKGVRLEKSKIRA